jgi:hypothetical protein
MHHHEQQYKQHGNMYVKKKRTRETSSEEEDSSCPSNDSLEGNRTLHIHAVLNEMQGKGYVMAVYKREGGGPEHQVNGMRLPVGAGDTSRQCHPSLYVDVD